MVAGSPQTCVTETCPVENNLSLPSKKILVAFLGVVMVLSSTMLAPTGNISLEYPGAVPLKMSPSPHISVVGWMGAVMSASYPSSQ